MAFIGDLPRFYSSYDDWQAFIERLEQAFELNNVADDKKKALLINCIDQSIYKTLRDICYPDVPKDKTYSELCELMGKQFTTKSSVFRERCTFYNAKQKDDESVTEWFHRVKKLSLECKFGEQFANVVLDRFVSGLTSPAIMDRLCEEEVGQLTIEHALEIAQVKEANK